MYHSYYVCKGKKKRNYKEIVKKLKEKLRERKTFFPALKNGFIRNFLAAYSWQGKGGSDDERKTLLLCKLLLLNL